MGRKLWHALCAASYRASLCAHLMCFIQSNHSTCTHILLEEDAQAYVKQRASSLERNAWARKINNSEATGLELLEHVGW
jgi:hypothetical protein